MAERRSQRGLLDPESEAIAEAYAALPAVRRQTRGLLSLEPQQDQSMAQTALEAVLGFIPGVGQALAARDIERARRADDPAAAAMAATEFLPLGRLAGMMRRPGPIMSELDVYHGTPHKFPATEANPLGEFDASKIGTGEGAQAYGHGIYFAESPSVAKAYQNPNAGSMFLGSRGINVSGKTYSSSGQLRKARDEATDMTEKAMYDILATAQSKGIDGPSKIAKAIKDNPVAWGSWEFGQDTLNAAMKRIRKEASFSSQKGSFYKADLPDEMIDRMLDWDKPLSEQPAAVREHVMRYMNVKEGGLPADMSVINTGGGKYVVVQEKPPLPGATFGIPRTITKGPRADSPEAAIKAYWNNLKGEDFYKTLSGDIGEGAAASEHLRSLGIPGVRYLDAGSRGQGGSGTRNFVVFPGEEKKVKILERK